MDQSQILQPCPHFIIMLPFMLNFRSKIYLFQYKHQGWTKSTLKSILLVTNWISSKKIIFFVKNVIWYQRSTFQDTFFPSLNLHSRKYIFDLNFIIKGSIIMKWGHGCKIWDWSIILHYFTEYLTCMLTSDLRSYRSSNLVIDLKLWEKFESNLPVCARVCLFSKWQKFTM